MRANSPLVLVSRQSTVFASVCVVMHMGVCYGVQLMACDMQCVGDSTSREFEADIAQNTNHINPHVNTHSCMTR